MLVHTTKKALQFLSSQRVGSKTRLESGDETTINRAYGANNLHDRAIKFHGHNIHTNHMTSKCTTRYFLTASVEVFLRRDATNRMTSSGGATMSNFTSRIKPF